jgi:hypothetical protein
MFHASSGEGKTYKKIPCEIVNDIIIVKEDVDSFYCSNRLCDISLCKNLISLVYMPDTKVTIVLPESVTILSINKNVELTIPGKSNLKKLTTDILPDFDITTLKTLEFTEYIEEFTIPTNLERLRFNKICNTLICPDNNRLVSLCGKINNFPPELKNLEFLFGIVNYSCKMPKLKEVYFHHSKGTRLYPAKIFVSIDSINYRYKRSKNMDEGALRSVKDASYNLRLRNIRNNKFLYNIVMALHL